MEASFVPFDGIFIDYCKSSSKNDMRVQHYHDTYEIYLQISGERYLFYDDICYSLKAGDLVIFKPFEPHYSKSREINFYERYVVNFPSTCLLDFLSKSEINILFDKLTSCVVHLSDKQASEIINYFKNIEKFSKVDWLLADKLTYSAIFQLVVVINNWISRIEVTESQHIQPEIVNALEYINNHYRENITLNELADIVHLSRYHFCRLFHSVTGATFTEHLYNLRLSKAHKLLKETKLSLNEIAEKTGFTSTAHMSRVFKRIYSVSPREFRKNTKIQ